MSLLGIDVGMTGCKAAAYAVDGTPLAQAQSDYRPVRDDQGAYELDVREVWAAVRQAIRQVAAQSKGDPIRALSVSSLGVAMIPLSMAGHVLGPCLLGPDPRGAECLRQVEAVLGIDRLFDITRNGPEGSYTLPKLCWLRDQRAELFHDTGRFVFWPGLISYLLGGASTADYSLANGTLLFDVARQNWSQEILDQAGLPRDKLPELAPAGKLVGAVSSTAARDLDLPSDVRMVLGGHDLCCSALGAGVIQPGMALYSIGANVQLVPAFHAVPLYSLMLRYGLNIEHHVVPGLYVSSLYSRFGGTVLRWFRDHLAPLEKHQAQKRGLSAYDTLLSEMPDEPTDLIVLPQFARDSGAILGLDLETSRGELVKGLLEGITYHFAQGQQQLEEMGIPVQVYRAATGGSRSEPWLQLTADILGAPVERLQNPDPATLGAALLAGVGCGAYAGYEEAVEAAVRIQDRFEPDARRHARYRRKVALYRELEPVLQSYLERPR